MRKLALVIILLIATCLTACTEGIISSSAVPDSYAKCNTALADIYVPAEIYSSPEDYTGIVRQTFSDMSAVDKAKIELSNMLVEGTTGSDDYLFTSNKEFLYYIWAVDNIYDWTSIDTSKILSQVNINGLKITDTGRLITSFELQKAILRVNFENTGFNGNAFQYQGYLTVIQSGSKSYYLICGYCSATKEQLSSCFTTSKCFRIGGQG